MSLIYIDKLDNFDPFFIDRLTTYLYLKIYLNLISISIPNTFLNKSSYIIIFIHCTKSLLTL
ncbi:MAG: hypothetical protein KatS3mg035_0041 [Bacteroidia bacterium]|nr:MAG: hypothetical protein KatS3mg035_0041 [Bacteroidia bacterium]